MMILKIEYGDHGFERYDIAPPVMITLSDEEMAVMAVMSELVNSMILSRSETAWVEENLEKVKIGLHMIAAAILNPTPDEEIESAASGIGVDPQKIKDLRSN